MMWWIVACALALGADASELTLERGRAALELGELDRARELAAELLQSETPHPEARQLYVDAMMAAGMGPRGLLEVAGFPQAILPWQAELQALVDARDALDEAAMIRAAKALQERWPDRPDLLVDVYATSAPKGAMRRYRKKLADRVVADTDLRRDPVYLYRARILLMAARTGSEIAATALAATGEDRPADRPTPTAFEAAEIARVLTHEEGLDSAAGLGTEGAADVLDRAAEIALTERRRDRAIVLWDAVEPHTTWAATGRARAWLGLEDAMQAIDAADDAAVIAADPWLDDFASLDVSSRADAWINSLELRALALESSGHRVQAFTEQATADQLANRKTLTDIADRLRKSALPGFESVKSQYSIPLGPTALNQARKALDAGDAEAAMRHAVHSSFLYAWTIRGDWRVDCAESRAIQARAARLMGNEQAERASWSLALLLRPDAPASWWIEAAEAHERAGHADAAFARYATAGLRDPELDLAEQLARTHRGLGDPLASAASVAIPAPEPKRHQDAMRVARGVQYRFATAQPVTRVGEGPLGEAPQIGQRMPSWSVQLADGGSLSSSHMVGRTTVLLFWTSSCTPCMRALEEAGDLARDLKKTGRDVAVVAISLDTEARHFEEVKRTSHHHVTLAHDPVLGARLGVSEVPTTWVVDHRGNVQYYSPVWPGGRGFERALRRALQE